MSWLRSVFAHGGAALWTLVRLLTGWLLPRASGQIMLNSAARTSIVLLGCMVGLAAEAQTPPSESAVMAGFVYNFGKFVEWPEGTLAARSAINLCLLGSTQELGDFAAVHGRIAQGYPLQVSYPTRGEELRRCNILFIARSEKGRLRETLRAVEGRSILTISNVDGFVDDGGIIGLITRGGKVQFSINLAVSRLAKLKVSSQLLRLAQDVKEGESN